MEIKKIEIKTTGNKKADAEKLHIINGIEADKNQPGSVFAKPEYAEKMVEYENILNNNIDPKFWLTVEGNWQTAVKALLKK